MAAQNSRALMMPAPVACAPSPPWRSLLTMYTAGDPQMPHHRHEILFSPVRIETAASWCYFAWCGGWLMPSLTCSWLGCTRAA